MSPANCITCFKDVYLFNDKIYFFGHEILTPGKINAAYSTKNFNIIILDLYSFKLFNKYEIKLGEGDEIYSCAIREKKGQPVIVIARSTEDGNVIVEYR